MVRDADGHSHGRPELFRDRSPITYLDGITAPLLIFQGANDTNVPKAESERLYKTLKDKGRDAQLVVYPDEGHGFTKRVNRIDYLTRLVEFFAAKLGDKASAVSASIAWARAAVLPGP